MSYVYGRRAESDRLGYVRKHRQAILGSRFRGSKISVVWIRTLGFNPPVDLWYITRDGKIFFESYKASRHGTKRKAWISPDEISRLRLFADLFKGSPYVWVGYVLKNAYRKPKEVQLN